MKLPFIALLLLLTGNTLAQNTIAFADSIRKEYRIPELNYAVVSADSVYELQALGTRKVNTDFIATINDRFCIGSNTKAITGFIATQLVKAGKLSWYTKFFDLFPEMKNDNNKPYQDLTLLELLAFRANLSPYTYTNEIPTQDQFTGSEDTQRYQFAKWFFDQEPVNSDAPIIFSNLDYVAAGLMLERASGKSYKTLVNELGANLGITFGFGRPNVYDSLETWGHDAHLIPEAPATDNYRLNWLQAAGNINITLPDYIKFIQLQLKGLAGKSDVLPQKTFMFLHYGLPQFSVGWFSDVDSANGRYSYNEGNPGTFLSKVYVFKDINRAFIIFSNVQSDRAEIGMDALFDYLVDEYGR